MEKRTPRPKLSILVFALFLVLCGSGKGLFAAAGTEASLDVVVKIKDLGNVLDLLQDFMAPEPGKPSLSPALLLQGMLHGTDWMDPSRPIVVGIRIAEPRPEAAALIPYLKPNEAFQTAYQASSGAGCYLVSLPPGPDTKVPAEIQAELVALSRAHTDHTISVEVSLKRVLQKHSEKIRTALRTPEIPPSGTVPKPSPLSGEEIRAMAESFIETAGQVEIATFGLDLGKERIRTELGATAVKGSRLEKLFRSDSVSSRLSGYTVPDHQIGFRTQAYPVAEMMAFLKEHFGKLYERMGIDFAALVGISEHFTGETAGGVSYGRSRLDMEMMAVLKKAADEGFLEKELLPRMEAYTRSMTAMVETQTGVKRKNAFVRTPDSRVAGHRVVGFKTEFPVFQAAADLHPPEASSRPMTFQIRMAVERDLLLAAPDDKRLKRLMEISDTLQEKPGQGPLMTMEIDMGAYMQALLEMLPGAEGSLPALPKTGKATFSLDMKDGRAVAVSAMGTDDIKKLAEAFRKATADMGKPSKPVQAKKTKASPPVPPEPGAKEVQKKKEPIRDARYWFDRGALVAAYGNNRAAIGFFQKTIALSPSMAEAYFNLGVAYGETEDYRNGLDAIDRALALGSPEDLCYYARGRIHIQAGDMEKGLSDIRQAAALGNEDAKAYLDRHE